MKNDNSYSDNGQNYNLPVDEFPPPIVSDEIAQYFLASPTSGIDLCGETMLEYDDSVEWLGECHYVLDLLREEKTVLSLAAVWPFGRNAYNDTPVTSFHLYLPEIDGTYKRVGLTNQLAASFLFESVVEAGKLAVSADFLVATATGRCVEIDLPVERQDEVIDKTITLLVTCMARSMVTSIEKGDESAYFAARVLDLRFPGFYDYYTGEHPPEYTQDMFGEGAHYDGQ